MNIIFREQKSIFKRVQTCGSTELPAQQELRLQQEFCTGNSPPSLTHPSVSHHPRPYHMVLNGLFATLSAFLIERAELCVCL